MSAKICSWISQGDLRLHKVPVTQPRVLFEARTTDGSTPWLAWSPFSHTHTLCKYAQWTASDNRDYTPTQHVCTPKQTCTKSSSSFHAAIRCVISHMVSVCILFLSPWCVQLHCRLISFLTQQSWISPCGSYTAQHMIALHWWRCRGLDE